MAKFTIHMGKSNLITHLLMSDKGKTRLSYNMENELDVERMFTYAKVDNDSILLIEVCSQKLLDPLIVITECSYCENSSREHWLLSHWKDHSSDNTIQSNFWVYLFHIEIGYYSLLKQWKKWNHRSFHNKESKNSWVSSLFYQQRAAKVDNMMIVSSNSIPPKTFATFPPSSTSKLEIMSSESRKMKKSS